MSESHHTSPLDPTEQEALWRAFVSEQRSGDGRSFESHWHAFQQIFANRRAEDGPPVVWRPDTRTLDRANLSRAMKENEIDDYETLHRWSVQNKSVFWEYALRRLGIVFEKEPGTILDLSGGVTDPRWLPGAEMSCIDSCFSADPAKPAIISGGEGDTEQKIITYGELERLVNRFANGLHEQGIETDTAIALYMPMTIQCVIAYLAIIRAGCRVVSIADSFSVAELKTRMEIAHAQIVLTVESYVRAGKTMSMYDKVIEAGVPRAIVIPAEKGGRTALRDKDILWDDMLSANDVYTSAAGDPYRIINVLFSSGYDG